MTCWFRFRESRTAGIAKAAMAILLLSCNSPLVKTTDAFVLPRGTTAAKVKHDCGHVLFSSSSSDGDSTASTTESLSQLVKNLPTIDELNTAPFMKQVGYGSEMTDALLALQQSDESDATKLYSETLRAALTAQLSHSDGIRGFMVSYLTGVPGDDNTDSSLDAESVAKEADPGVLLETLSKLLATGNDVESSDELVSLMCMNVIMPIAMITKHQDPALSEASKLTAARGIRLLGSVLTKGSDCSIRSNLEAIQRVADAEASSENNDDKVVDYWTKFFGKWGYEDPQKKDIAATMQELLSRSSSSS